MPAPVSGVSPSPIPIQPVGFASKPAAISAPAAPLRFLETRDLFFSSHSIRASIDPFLNDTTQKKLYLQFEQKGGFLKRFGRASHAVVVLEKHGANVSLNTAQYTPDDTVISTLFMPQLDTFYWLEKPAASPWQQLLHKLFGAAFDENRIRLPKAQEGIVRDHAPESHYVLQPGDKNSRTKLRDDVLAAISALEDAGYQLQDQQTTAQPVAANPFLAADLSPAAVPALQPG